MLIDHAKPEGMGVLRIGDRLLPPGDQHLAFGLAIVAHDAFHQRALAGTVLAEQGMKRSGPHLEVDIVEREELAKPHGHGEGVGADGAGWKRHFADDHDSAPITVDEWATAPNTPPCILIILRAWSWLALSVAAQQSSTRTHSKPRSLASRMVV